MQADIKRQTSNKDSISLFPLDSTIVTLTSKLLWEQEYHQVKLFAGTDNKRGMIDGVHIHFGQGYDSQYGDETIAATPQNGVAIMDRGFSSSECVQEFLRRENHYFVLIKNNSTINRKEDGTYEVWSDQRKVQVRLVIFSDVETRTEFRLVTNLPESGELTYTNEEIGEIYRRRWQIELLGKFLKMPLKLARLITKNTNGIRIQIYACLICYLLLQLIKVPDEIGNKLLEKLRYLQAFMCEKISYIHWFKELVLKS